MGTRHALVLALTLVSLGASASGLAGCGAAARTDGGSGLLPSGSVVPELEGPDQSGTMRRIKDERGHALVVFFYPKDGTPGCTREACAFRDTWELYRKAGVQIFGVSADDAKSHEQFAKEQHLPFPIVADPGHTWSAAFGVSTKLGMDSRVSFLVDGSGKVARVYPKVDPGLHAAEVLKDVASLGPGPSPSPSPQGAPPSP
jgi:peroxiredoxin Q/BCP